VTTTTVKAGTDAWVDSTKPSKNHGNQDKLKVLTDPDTGNTAYAFVYLANPASRKTTVSSASLNLHAAGDVDFDSAVTVTAELVKGSWNQGKVTWDKQPDVTGPAASVNVGTHLGEGDLIPIDVTQQTQLVALGTKFYGWRISTDSPVAHAFSAFGSGKMHPRLTVTYEHGPPVPVPTVPIGIVSVAKPRIQFDAASASTTGGILSFRVQIDPGSNFVTPAWDSGEVTDATPELDLSATTYPGLANGTSTAWRVGVKGRNNVWVYSLPVTMSRVELPAAVDH
jgi:hypothetical protein